MSHADPAAQPLSPDPVEDLLGECLAQDRIHEAIAAACRVHPAHAEALRARFAALMRMGMAPEEPRVEGPRRLGRFTLHEQLGGGGMGVVWLASEQPLGRPVALKLVRSEQLCLDSARGRFLREIEAAAALSHAGIVPILGFGEADGMPWYSMPVVEGRSLLQVLTGLRGQTCEPLPASLHRGEPNWPFACCAIVLQVALALAHAHDRGVVHRDIKPSNIMLTPDGRALLIDFGLAQVDGADSITRSGVQPGSLAYMSPEQVRGEVVDGRTDIWSLGVVLYELLTRRQPFVADTEAAIRSNILAALPTPPTGGGSRVPWAVATVVQKAMAPERLRRYATMAAFAADLEAVLGHRPIAARAAGPWLRLLRFARRRPTLTTALAFGGLLSSVGPSVLLLQERNAHQAIEREARTSRRVVALLADLFREVEPERARGATVPARVVLDRGVRQIRQELDDEPAVKAALLEAMGTVYLNLGLIQDAAALLDEMTALWAPQIAVDAPLRARTADLRARLAMARGDAATGERLWREVIAALPDAGGPDGVPAAIATLQLAHAIWRQDRLDEADSLFEHTVADLRTRLAPDEPRLAEAVLAQAVFLQERMDPRRARPLFDEALHTLQMRLPADHPRLLAAQVSAAANLNSLGAYAEAAGRLRAVITIAEDVFDPHHPQLAMAREQMAEVLIFMSDAAGARQQIDLARDAYREIYSPPHFVLARARALDGTIAFEQGDLAAAETALDDALAMYERLYPDGSLDRASALNAACRLYLACGRLEAAEAAGRASLAMAEKHGQRDPAARALAHAHLAYVLALAGRFDVAGEYIAAALRLCADRPEVGTHAFVRSYAAEVRCLQRDGEQGELMARAAMTDWERLGSDSGRGWALTTLGWALELRQDYQAAEVALRQALAIRERFHGPQHPYVAITWTGLGTVLARQQKLPEAEQALREAITIRRRRGSPDDLNLGRPRINLAVVLFRQGRHEESAAELQACTELFAGRVGRGHAEGTGVVLLALMLLKTPAAQRVRAFGDGVREIARVVYPEGHANLQSLDDALAH